VVAVLESHAESPAVATANAARMRVDDDPTQRRARIA